MFDPPEYVNWKAESGIIDEFENTLKRDPERARRNIAARDALLRERIASSCDELGLRWVRIDGSLDLDDSIALLEQHFRPHLPAQPNV